MNIPKKLILFSLIAIIVVEILVLILILNPGLFFIENSQKKQNNEDQKIDEIKDNDLIIWKHNTLGIEFQYPKEWGEPEISPNTNITNLELLAQEGENRNDHNVYKHSLSIYFTNPLKTHRISLVIHNDEYEGEFYPNARAYVYGPIDNFDELKTSENICDYKIDFLNNPSQTGTIEEIYSDCQQNTKTILLKKTQHFNFGDYGTKYTYSIRRLGFKKLKNGYFNNLLITNSVGSTSQIDNPNVSFDYFLDYDLVNGGKISQEEYKKNEDDFIKFVNSIRVFKPIPIEIGIFQEIENENPDITTIRKYYYNIISGNLEKAYDMYGDKNINFETYTEWYQNTIMANPRDFKLIDKNTYQFFVDLQDHNQEPEIYRIIMAIDDNKIISTDSEKITVKEIIFEDLSSFAKSKQGINYVILKHDGVETAIDQAPDEFDNGIGGVLRFYHLEFSPKGNYLLYKGSGWEWITMRIYDLAKKSIVRDFDFGSKYGFDENETQFYICNSAGMGNGSVGIYTLPDFEIKKDLFDLIAPKSAMGVDCKINNEKKLLVTFSCLIDGAKEIDCENEINIEYDLDTDLFNIINN